MKILTVNKLPETQEEMDFLKQLFYDDIVINIYDGSESVGIRNATTIEEKFLNELINKINENK